jgi:tripartite-type tricarboxylate transporter receptor subunit TctC
MQRPAHWAAVLALAAFLPPAEPAAGEDYPNRTVTIVAPSAPGGMYSILARLMVTASTTMATNVALHKNLPYDPRVDFVPVTLIALTPEVLLVNAALPVRSIDDLVKLARATPGGLSFGSAGPGTTQHLNGELLKSALGIELHHVPYKGIQPALNDLAGGHIPLMTAPIPVALPLAQGGRVRMLGVTTKERVEVIAEVPALAEIGVPGYHARSWFMLVAPARTPPAVVDKLHADLAVLLREADVREEFIKRQGLIPVASPPPEELKRFVDSEIARLGEIVRNAGLAGSE